VQRLDTGQEGITEEVKTVVLKQLTIGCRVIKIPKEIIGLPNLEIQEKLQGLSHLDLDYFWNEMKVDILQ
jgi:hypothetical protein